MAQRRPSDRLRGRAKDEAQYDAIAATRQQQRSAEQALYEDTRDELEAVLTAAQFAALPVQTVEGKAVADKKQGGDWSKPQRKTEGKAQGKAQERSKGGRAGT